MGLANSPVNALVICEANIFAGTEGSGVWKRPLSEMTSIKELCNNGIITKYSLEQNYPNPFNPNTTIKYSLPRSSHVSIILYNSLGQKVANLISKEMNAGIYTSEWNASGFVSGVYYCRMVAGDFVQTRKLMLLK